MYKSVLAITVLLACASAAPSQAQRRTACPGNEMRSRSGECVNPALAADMRCRSNRMNQVMINQWMPAPYQCSDRGYPRGFDVNRFESSIHGTGSTSP